jgi:hypothetical protein
MPKKAQFTHERVEFFCLIDEPLKESKSRKIFKISFTFRFDKLWHLSKSVHTVENSQILTVSNKKIFIIKIFCFHLKSMIWFSFFYSTLIIIPGEMSFIVSMINPIKKLVKIKKL